MTKLRVHELAKKLGVDNKDILSTLAELGIKGKTHSSAIEPEITDKVEKLLKKNRWRLLKLKSRRKAGKEEIR